MAFETGNPVFDYRTSFRRRAALLQSVLMRAGLLVFIVAGALWLAKAPFALSWSGCVAIAGGATLLAGLIWGYCWRDALVREFKRKFGPD